MPTLRDILVSPWTHTIGGAALGTVLGYGVSFLDIAPTAYSKGYRDGVLFSAKEYQSSYESDLKNSVQEKLPAFCDIRVSTLNKQCDNIIEAKDAIIKEKDKRIESIFTDLVDKEKKIDELNEMDLVVDFLTNLMSESQRVLQNLDISKKAGRTREIEWQNQAKELILDIAKSQDLLVEFALIFNGKTDKLRKRINANENVTSDEIRAYFNYFIGEASRKLDIARRAGRFIKESSGKNYYIPPEGQPKQQPK